MVVNYDEKVQVLNFHRLWNCDLWIFVSDAMTCALNNQTFHKRTNCRWHQRATIFCRSPLCSIRRTGAGGCRSYSRSCEDASKILGKMEKTQHRCDELWCDAGPTKQALQNIIDILWDWMRFCLPAGFVVPMQRWSMKIWQGKKLQMAEARDSDISDNRRFSKMSQNQLHEKSTLEFTAIMQPISRE